MQDKTDINKDDKGQVNKDEAGKLGGDKSQQDMPKYDQGKSKDDVHTQKP